MSRKVNVSDVYRNGIIVVLGLGAVLSLTLAWLPIDYTIGRFIYDDMFYYLRVAQFIAEGHGSTFDGIAFTNGYHPAWMLICVALASVAKGELLVHLVLTVSAMLHVLQGFVLSRLLLRVASPLIALLLTLLYVVNWRTLAINMCGLETPLATLLLLLVFYRMTGEKLQASYRFAASMGVLAGVAALSRFDLLLLVAFVGVWLVFSKRYSGGITADQRVKQGLVFALVATAVLSLWFVFSLSVSSTLLPNSRTAVKFLTGVSYNVNDLGQMFAMLQSQIWSAIWWSADSANLFGLVPVIGGPHGLDLLGAALLALLAGGVALGCVLLRSDRRVAIGGAALLYCCLHGGYYVIFHRIELRYVLPPIALFFVPMAAVIGALVDRWQSSIVQRLAVLAYTTSFAFATVAGVSAFQNGFGSVRVHKYHYVAMDTARWLAANRPGERVGAWNAGILGYFSGTVLSNLDGVINDDALKAVQSRTIDRFILDSRIRLIVDEPTQIRDNLIRFSGSGGDPPWLGPVLHLSQDAEGRRIVVREVIAP